MSIIVCSIITSYSTMGNSQPTYAKIDEDKLRDYVKKILTKHNLCNKVIYNVLVKTLGVDEKIITSFTKTKHQVDFQILGTTHPNTFVEVNLCYNVKGYVKIVKKYVRYSDLC